VVPEPVNSLLLLQISRLGDGAPRYFFIALCSVIKDNQSLVNVLVHVNEKRTRIQGHSEAELRWQKWQIGYVYEHVQEHVHVGLTI
jgi:hypothetical protein